MKNIFTFIMVAGILGAGYLILPSMFAPSIFYQDSAEVGQEVVVHFAPWVFEGQARSSFHIEPMVEGELTWLGEFHELHFVPTQEFAPDVSYQVTAGTKSMIAAALNPSGTFTFTSPQAQKVSAQKPVTEFPSGRYLDVNLSTMVLTTVENGKPVNAYPIVGKGNPWLTPTREGTFHITEKKDRNFSTIYRVWQPYNMRYSGPYSMHGIPYWPSGARLTSVYSGGCVRLRDDVARVVFDWVEVGTPVVVHSTAGRFGLFPSESIQDGDLVREMSSSAVYVVKFSGGKRFRRHVLTEKFAEWYAHLAPFRARVKIVPDGSLASYITSRWIKAASGGYVWEVNSAGTKHLINCGVEPGSVLESAAYCQTSWAAYGWDPDELFTVSQSEIDFYATSGPISLPQAAHINASR